MPVRRILVTAIATTAIAAPAATAQPADMHAPVAVAAARAQHRQDLRSPDAVDAAQRPRKTVDAPGATAVGSQSITPVVPPGQPTWAINTKPIASTPVAAAAPVDDGVDWLTVGLGIAGSLLALGGIVALTSRHRSLPRTRVSV